jgi:SNF2-related domain/Helicase conserved C-terminal domain
MSMARRAFRSNQKQMFKFIYDKNVAALFVEMRLGKTLVAIRWALTREYAEKFLVVCPIAAFKSWQDELRLENEPEPILVVGSKNKREELLNSDSKWFITNYDSAKNMENLPLHPWSVVILDESRVIAGEKSKVGKFFSKRFYHVPYKLVLTGTEAPESKLEYYHQLRFLSSRIFFSKSFWAFRAKHFVPNENNDWVPTPSGEAFINERLAKVAFFQTQRDAGVAAIKRYQTVLVNLSKEAWEVYRKIANEFILELRGNEIDSTVFATTKAIWMRRLVGGFVDGAFVFKEKLEALRDLLIGQLRGKKIVVVCMFIMEIEAYYDELRKDFKVMRVHGSFPKKKSERDIELSKFTEGEMEVCIIQPHCFKYAKDFSVSKTMVFMSSPASLETRLQVEARISNVSKQSQLTYIDVLAKNTIDEQLQISLIRKETRQAQTRRMVKHLQAVKSGKGN